MVGLINHTSNSIFGKNRIQRVFPNPVTFLRESTLPRKSRHFSQGLESHNRAFCCLSIHSWIKLGCYEFVAEEAIQTCHTRSNTHWLFMVSTCWLSCSFVQNTIVCCTLVLHSSLHLLADNFTLLGVRNLSDRSRTAALFADCKSSRPQTPLMGQLPMEHITPDAVWQGWHLYLCHSPSRQYTLNLYPI